MSGDYSKLTKYSNTLKRNFCTVYMYSPNTSVNKIFTRKVPLKHQQKGFYQQVIIYKNIYVS